MDPTIWVGCNADAVTELVNQGLDLTQRSSFLNETVLHYWAGGHYFWNVDINDGISYQEVSLGVVKLLIRKAADLLALDEWDFTPLLVAANGPFRGDDLPNLKVLDFLLEREEYSRAEKIEAMELAGAVILKNTENISLLHKAFDYWRKALNLRYIEVYDSGYIEKPRLNIKNLETTEWNTSAELDYYIEHPDRFVIQSYFVRLRILSSKKWSAMSSSLFGTAILDYFIWQLQHQRRFFEIFDIFWTTLETLLSRSDLEENEDAQCKMGKVVEKLIDILERLKSNSPAFLTEKFIKTSLDLIVSAAKFHVPVSRSLFPLAKNLSRLKKFILLNKDTFEAFSKVRYQRGENMLHKAIHCAIDDTKLYATARFLLYAGCDPNAINHDGNTPLHFLAEMNERHLFGKMDIIAVLLLDFGAELNQKNAVGKTAADLLLQKNERHSNIGQGIIGWKLPNWCTELPTLMCLSARVIRRNKIPYLEVPSGLISEIEKHNMI